MNFINNYFCEDFEFIQKICILCKTPLEFEGKANIFDTDQRRLECIKSIKTKVITNLDDLIKRYNDFKKKISNIKIPEFEKEITFNFNELFQNLFVVDEKNLIDLFRQVLSAERNGDILNLEKDLKQCFFFSSFIYLCN